MTILFEKQIQFSRLVARFINDLNDMGYEVTLGEAWRSPETCELYAKEGKGISDSLHSKRLAIDLCLFWQDIYLSETSDYLRAGQLWESYSISQSLCCSWGGRFSHPDGNHFSVEYQGVR